MVEQETPEAGLYGWVKDILLAATFQSAQLKHFLEHLDNGKSSLGNRECSELPQAYGEVPSKASLLRGS